MTVVLFVSGVTIDVNVNPRVPPVAQAIRKVPINLEDKVEQKLDEMLKQHIIEPVNEPREWISPMVVVLKPD